MKIQIKPGLEIGDGCKPFIIAEVGSNWRTLDDCLLSIAHAKLCGADAVKFQAFTLKDLYGVDHPLTDPSNYTPPNKPAVLPLEWLPKLKVKADAVGIEFMCSAFSPELVSAVDPYVNIHKVASAEMTHVRILEKLRELGKPVILSTGASGPRDIEQALLKLEGVLVVLMYCVAAYPARTVDLTRIQEMRDRFKCPVGFSDHTTDAVTIPGLAVAGFGASVLEKHVQFVEGEFPDSLHSLNADEFSLYVKAARGYAIGHLPLVAENPMILRHNRRLIATQDVQPGQALVEGKNFGIYRSLKDDTHALSPFAIDAVVGRSAKRTIKAGDGIGPGDF